MVSLELGERALGSGRDRVDDGTYSALKGWSSTTSYSLMYLHLSWHVAGMLAVEVYSDVR